MSFTRPSGTNPLLGLLLCGRGNVLILQSRRCGSRSTVKLFPMTLMKDSHLIRESRQSNINNTASLNTDRLTISELLVTEFCVLLVAVMTRDLFPLLPSFRPQRAQMCMSARYLQFYKLASVSFLC